MWFAILLLKGYHTYHFSSFQQPALVQNDHLQLSLSYIIVILSWLLLCLNSWHLFTSIPFSLHTSSVCSLDSSYKCFLNLSILSTCFCHLSWDSFQSSQCKQLTHCSSLEPGNSSLNFWRTFQTLTEEVRSFFPLPVLIPLELPVFHLPASYHNFNLTPFQQTLKGLNSPMLCNPFF